MKLKNTILTLIMVVGASFLIATTASAAVCSPSLINKYNSNQLDSASIEEIKSCSCSSLDSGCLSMKEAHNNYANGKGVNDVGTKYYLRPMKIDEKTYSDNMASLVAIIKSILNIAIGVTLFILGGGFLWQMSNLGINASSPQKRQMSIDKLGEIFATALFLGLIPIIFNFVFGVIQGLQ